MAERIMHHSGCVERMGGWSCHPHCEIRARRAPALELDRLRARCGELEGELERVRAERDYEGMRATDWCRMAGQEGVELDAARERLAAWEPVILAVFRMVRATWNRNQFYDSLGSDMRKAIGAIPKEHAPGMDQLCRTLDVPPLSPPLGPRDAARGGDETSGASPRGSSDPAPIHGDYGRGQAQEPGPAAAREPEEAATLLDTARSEQSGSGPAEAGGLASVPRAGVADNTGTFSPAPSGEVCNGERASESRLQITPCEKELADELLEAPRAVTFDSYSAPSGEPARAQMYREQTPDGAPLPAPSGDVCGDANCLAVCPGNPKHRCARAFSHTGRHQCEYGYHWGGIGRAEWQEAGRADELRAVDSHGDPIRDTQIWEKAGRAEGKGLCVRCEQPESKHRPVDGGNMCPVYATYFKPESLEGEIVRAASARVAKAEKERDELRARLETIEQWKLDAQAVLTDALGDFYESDWTDKANALLEDKPAQSVLLAEQLKAAEAERDVLAGALRELRDAEEAFLEHDSPTSFGRMSAARAAADKLLEGEK